MSSTSLYPFGQGESFTLLVVEVSDFSRSIRARSYLSLNTNWGLTDNIGRESIAIFPVTRVTSAKRIASWVIAI